MRRLENDSTTPPEFPCPFDERYGYRLTLKGLQALQEYEELHGEAVARKVPLPDGVAEALEADDRREQKRLRRKAVRDRGNRMITVCCRSRKGRRVPDIRLTGLWLLRAGFDLGQECEVEVEPGAVLIRTI